MAATGLLLLLTSSSTEAWVTPKPVHRSVATRAVVDDETNYNPELYSPKAIKTIRKEVAKLRKTNKLTGFALPSGDPDIHLTEDDDVEVEFTPETLSQVESLLEVHELVEVQKLSPGNIKLVYDVAAGLAMVQVVLWRPIQADTNSIRTLGTSCDLCTANSIATLDSCSWHPS